MSAPDASLAPTFDAPPASALVADGELYMRAHPELTALLTDFTCAALQARPDDVSLFAANYFAPGLANGGGAGGLSARPTHQPQQSSVSAAAAAVAASPRSAQQ